MFNFYVCSQFSICLSSINAGVCVSCRDSAYKAFPSDFVVASYLPNQIFELDFQAPNFIVFIWSQMRFL